MATMEMTNEKAKKILEVQRRRQEKGHILPCPRCGHEMNPDLTMNALSRRVGVYICSRCGTEEAFEDMANARMELKAWSLPQSFA
jgi:Uncharacterized Zn ribbon-containing protein